MKESDVESRFYGCRGCCIHFGLRVDAIGQHFERDDGSPAGQDLVKAHRAVSLRV